MAHIWKKYHALKESRKCKLNNEIFTLPNQQKLKTNKILEVFKNMGRWVLHIACGGTIGTILLMQFPICIKTLKIFIL